MDAGPPKSSDPVAKAAPPVTRVLGLSMLAVFATTLFMRAVDPVIPQIAAFRRMVRQVEFDVCEIAPTTYIIARAYGAPFFALPIFVMRRFHHGGLLVRPEAGIHHPKDLEGELDTEEERVLAQYWGGVLANIRRALSLVPEEAYAWFQLVEAQYLPGKWMRDSMSCN